MSWASGLSWGLCRKIGPAEGTPVGKREENSYGGHAGHGNWWQSFDPHPFIQTLPPSKPPKLITDTVFFDDNLMKIQKNIVGRKSTPRFIMERGVPEMNQVIGPKEEGWEIVPSPFQRTVPMDQQVDSKKDHSEFASAVVGTSEEPHPLVKSLKTTASQAGVEQRTSASQYSKMDKEKETQYEKDTRDKGVQFKNETGDKETQYEKDVKEKGTQSKGIPVVKGTFPNQAFPPYPVDLSFGPTRLPSPPPLRRERSKRVLKKVRPRRLAEMVHVGPTGMDIDHPIYVEPKREGYFAANPIPTERPTVGLRRSDFYNQYEFPNVIIKRKASEQLTSLVRKKQKENVRGSGRVVPTPTPRRSRPPLTIDTDVRRRPVGIKATRKHQGKPMDERIPIVRKQRIPAVRQRSRPARPVLTINTDVPRRPAGIKATRKHQGKPMDERIPIVRKQRQK